MSESEKTVQGFLFATQSDYENAKKEYEVVTYLKANTDFTNVKVVYKLYEKLLEKSSFHTIIGYQFMSELRESIISSNVEFERVLKPVPVSKAVEAEVKSNKKKKKVDQQAEGKYKLLYENMRGKKNHARIINVFLIGIIIAMMVITWTSNHSSTDKLETVIQNKYASWEEKLNQREQAVEKKEAELKKLQESEK